MTEEDEQQTKLTTHTLHDMNNHRLYFIKQKLKELTREKAKYNVEKLTQDIDFLRNEISNLSAAVSDITKDIITQTNVKKTLNAKMQILRSNSRLHYPNLKSALEDKERNERELEKPNKSNDYRKLAQQKIESIVQALPQLEEQHRYIQLLEQAENIQMIKRDKREKLLENLNSKSRKQAETKQLLIDSATKLPKLEEEIECLRSERDHISTLIGKKTQRSHISYSKPKSFDTSTPSNTSHEQDTSLQHKIQFHNEKLENIRVLLKYFHEKISDHGLLANEASCSMPSFDSLLTEFEERMVLLSHTNERDDKRNSSITKTNNDEPKIAVAMKLPRNLIPLDIQSTTTNEILRSPHCQQKTFEYKKELPPDIISKYAGVSKKKQQHRQKKNKKVAAITHSSEMITLYNDICRSAGTSEALPAMPIYECDILSTIKALQLVEHNVESYLTKLSTYCHNELPIQIDGNPNGLVEDDDIRDSALDTFSETSSLTEPVNKASSANLQSLNIPQTCSSSSSDDKKTIVSSSSPSSSYSNSKLECPSSSIIPLTTVEESPLILSPLAIQIAQIERQVSDEGYRSVRNEVQQQTTNIDNHCSPLLARSHSYNSNEKVGQWLFTTADESSLVVTNDVASFENDIHFQATDIDNGDENFMKTNPANL